VAYNFLPYNQDQLFLMPPSVRDWVGEGSLSRFISDLVDELNEACRLRGFYGRYREDGWGRAAYHPCLMLKVLLYGYAVGVRSSRKLAQALQQDVAFRYLAANQQPDFRTLSDFRKEHLPALSGLFVEILELCKVAGLVELGIVALDGRRVAGAAAPERNRSKQQLQEMVEKILQEAADTDEKEDAQFGKDRRGDELPAELQTRAGRLKRIRAAIAQSDAQKNEAEQAQAERVRVWEEEVAQGRKPKGPKPSMTPRARVLKQVEEFRANTTDPESRTLKTRRSWVQGYNGQAMVDCSSQVIVAHDLTHEADDRGHLRLLLQRCEEQVGRRPDKCIADAGYWSEANAQLADPKTELFIAVDNEASTVRRRKRGARRKQLPEAMKMREKLETEEGSKIYRQRSRTVEPVFGQMCMRDLNRFLVRGLTKVRGEWALFCTTHNLLKVWRSGWQPRIA
jgi:transposase